MGKKKLTIFAISTLMLGLPGACTMVIVGEETCQGYCFDAGFPTSPLFYLGTALYLIGSGLALITWFGALARMMERRKWGCFIAILLAGCLGFLVFLIVLYFPQIS